MIGEANFSGTAATRGVWVGRGVFPPDFLKSAPSFGVLEDFGVAAAGVSSSTTGASPERGRLEIISMKSISWFLAGAVAIGFLSGALTTRLEVSEDCDTVVCEALMLTPEAFGDGDNALMDLALLGMARDPSGFGGRARFGGGDLGPGKSSSV